MRTLKPAVSAAIAAALVIVWPSERPSLLAAPAHARFVDVAAAAGVTRVLEAGRPGKDHLLDSAGAGAPSSITTATGFSISTPSTAGVSTARRWSSEARTRSIAAGPTARFEDVTAAAGVGGEGQWGAGAFVADYDGDGWPDILVTNFGPNVLYRNNGNGTFENVAKRVGIEAPGWNTGAAFFDADADGDLDLYIASYIAATIEDVRSAKPTLSWKGLEMVAFGPFGLKGAPDHYFRNDGGTFVDATLAAGLEDRALAFGFAVRAIDIDLDGDVDLYVANDSDANYLYRNEGNGTFREIGTWAGCGLDEKGAAQASMGIAAGDVTGDGRWDLFVTNFAEDFSTLYAGAAGDVFEDVSRVTGIGPMTFRPMSWGTAFADFDNDGDLDLVVANGHIYPQIDKHPELVGTFAQRSLYAENLGPGVVPQFRDATGEAGPGFEALRSGRGLAVGDYDNDGDPRSGPDQPRCAAAAPAQRRHQWRVADRHRRGQARRVRSNRDAGDRQGRRQDAAARHREWRLVPEHARSPSALRPRQRDNGR